MKERNLQNIDRDPQIRKLFIPRNPGEILLAGDLSQAEARVVAWKSCDRTMMELFNAGKKVHEFLGEVVFGKPFTKKLYPEKYECMKRGIHGYNYMMQPKRLAEAIFDELGIVVSVKECAQWQGIISQTFPRVQLGYHMGILEELRQKNMTITTPPLGWQRKFYGFGIDSVHREALAHYAQNIVAYITNNALNKLYYESWCGPYLYMQVHDEVLLSVPKDRLKEAAQELHNAMTCPIEMPGGMMTIPVELKVGKNYGEMIEYDLTKV